MSTSVEDMAIGVIKDLVKEVSAQEAQNLIDMLRAIAAVRPREFQRLAQLTFDSLAAKALVDKRFED